MTYDLKQRLRVTANIAPEPEAGRCTRLLPSAREMMREAADRIESLEAELLRCNAILGVFAKTGGLEIFFPSSPTLNEVAATAASEVSPQEQSELDTNNNALTRP